MHASQQAHLDQLLQDQLTLSACGSPEDLVHQSNLQGPSVRRATGGMAAAAAAAAAVTATAAPKTGDLTENARRSWGSWPPIRQQSIGSPKRRTHQVLPWVQHPSLQSLHAPDAIRLDLVGPEELPHV